MTNSYICVVPTRTVAAEIEFISKTIGFENRIPPDELHCTLLYATTGEQLDVVESVINKSAIYTAKPVGLSVLGEGDNRAIVLLLESDQLHERNSEFRLLLDDSWPEYKPHISLKYGATDDDVRLAKAYSKIFDITLASVILTSERTQVGDSNVQ